MAAGWCSDSVEKHSGLVEARHVADSDRPFSTGPADFVKAEVVFIRVGESEDALFQFGELSGGQETLEKNSTARRHRIRAGVKL
jgi:hypothetical protein